MKPFSEAGCPRCGALDVSESADGLCPGCLLVAVLDWEESEQEPAEGIICDECDGYVLGEVLGRGGYGIVYRAQRSGSEKVFALKMLASAHLAGPDELRRFRLEIESVSGLSHPHIVPVNAVGEADGLPYFVMDYMPRGNLADYLRQNAASHSGMKRAVSLVVKISRAVHFAHERGVLHRDLKPANILLSETGEPMVSDFGLARLIHTPSGVTMTGAALGTPAYMAPEQAAGGTITTAADGFSLGTILYHLLTGRPPFLGESPLEILQQVISRDVPDPRTFAAWIDRDLATICQKSLHRDPARRYGSVAVFADDLERWQRGETVMARPVAWPERMMKWCRRHPISATFGLTGSAAVLALTALFVVGSVLVRKERDYARSQEALAKENAETAIKQETLAKQQAALAQENALAAKAQETLAKENADAAQKQEALAKENAQRAKEQEAVAIENAQLASQLRDESRLNAYAADMYLANRALADGHLGQARRMLDRHRAEAGTSDLRGFEWYALERLCRGNELWYGAEHTAAVMAVAFAPDGKFLATAGRDGKLMVRDVSDGRVALRLPKPDAPGRFAEIPLMTAVSSKSAELASQLRSRKLTPDEVRFRGRPSTLGEISALAWSPDGAHLLSAGLGSYVRQWAIPSGKLTGLIPVTTASQLRFSNDGKMILVFCAVPDSQDRHELRVYAAADLSLMRVIPDLQAAHAFSPDGMRCAVIPLGRNDIEIYELSGEEPKFSWKCPASVKQLAFSADGQSLLGLESSGILISSWQVADGKLTHQVFPIAGMFEQFLPSPDGKRIAATGAGQLLTHQAIRADSPAVMLRGHEDTVQSLAFSPDGTMLASGGNDSTCRLWSAISELPSSDQPAEFERVESSLPAWIQQPARESLIWAQSSDGYWIGDGKAGGRLFFQPELETATPQRLAPPPEPYSRLIVSGDGKILAALAWPRTLWLQRGGTDLWSSPLRLSQGTVGPVVFSPDGKWLASGGDDNLVSIRSVASGELLATLRGHQGQLLALAFSLDGRTLVSSAADKTLRLWHAGTWRELGILHQGEAISHFVFSKCGTVLRATTRDGQQRDFRGKAR